MGLLLGILFFFLGCFLSIFSLYMYKKGKEASSWPYVTGTIIKSKIDGGLDDIPSPEIVYEYSVGNIQYKGRNLSFTEIHTDANKAVSEYQIGDSVSVFFNPNKPEDSALEVENTPTLKIQYVIGIVFCFCVSGYFIYSWM
jgi:hypothetical protein